MFITLDKALEILRLNLLEASPRMHPDVKASLQLAVEIMQREQLLRASRSFHPEDLLPSEAPPTHPPTIHRPLTTPLADDPAPHAEAASNTTE